MDLVIGAGGQLSHHVGLALFWFTELAANGQAIRSKSLSKVSRRLPAVP